MKKIFFSIIFTIFSLNSNAAGNLNAYDFEFTTIDGKKVNLNEFKGKPIFVAETPYACKFTLNYDELNSLSKSFEQTGLVIIAVEDADSKDDCINVNNLGFHVIRDSKIKNVTFLEWADSEVNNSKGKAKYNKFIITPYGEIIKGYPSGVRLISPDIENDLWENLVKKR